MKCVSVEDDQDKTACAHYLCIGLPTGIVKLILSVEDSIPFIRDGRGLWKGIGRWIVNCWKSGITTIEASTCILF